MSCGLSNSMQLLDLPGGFQQVAMAKLGSPRKVHLPFIARVQPSLTVASEGTWPRPTTAAVLQHRSQLPRCTTPPPKPQQPRSLAAEAREESSQSHGPMGFLVRSSVHCPEAESRSPPGLAPPEGLPSHGSVRHHLGTCRPCGWFWKVGGCQNGQDCEHCHLCLEGAAKHHKKDKRRIKRGLAKFMQLEFHLNGGLGEAFDTAACCKSAAAEEDSSQRSCEASTRGSPSLSASGSDPMLTPPPLVLRDELDGSEADLEGSDTVNSSSSHCMNTGSLLHQVGQCSPCAWFWKPAGCFRGDACRYCHLCPQSEVRERKRAKNAVLRAQRQALDGC